MDQKNTDIPFDPSRLGQSIDFLNSNYSEESLGDSLAQLEMLGVKWVVLKALEERAIPESFISQLIALDISPIIQFSLSLETPPIIEEFAGILAAYAKWGVQYVSFFEKVNLRSSWPSVGWTQRGLVSRFLELFLPLAKTAIASGLKPIFPSLAPGGDYWDTAFLRRALEEMKSKGEEDVISELTLSAVSNLNKHSIHWGAGGPENWPGAIPYYTPEDSEDHQGFRIFDWYRAISLVALEMHLPIILFADGNGEDLLAMAKQIAIPTNKEYGKLLEVPENVIAINFSGANELSSHWFHENGMPSSAGEKWLSWKSGRNELSVDDTKHETAFRVDGDSSANKKKHYLLLPTYPWGKSKFHQSVIKSFIKKHQPTVGYSLSQARKADRVTVVGGSQIFTEDIIQLLTASGCKVNHITGEANQIAAQLNRQ